MKVLFLHNIKGVAQIGDIKNVSDGYARNFLLPRKYARMATSGAEKQAETLKKQREIENAKSKEEALKLVKDMESKTVELIEDANDEGHLYGSVDAKKIAHALHVSVDQINLPHNLKTVGEHAVELQLHPEVSTSVKVIIKPIPRSQP